MSVSFQQLLDATISHLQDLKAQGVRHVRVSPEVVSALRQPLAARAGTTAPAPDAKSPPDPVRSAGAPHRASVTETNAVTVPVPAAAPAPAAPVLDPAAKAQAMAELRAQALACTKCSHLVATRKNVVFGVGDINAQLMFVGEAPGADEDTKGEPFVGAAGQLLTKIIVAMGLTRQTVYIGNILKCRPDTPNKAFGNRPPTPQEMETCLPYLLAQIDLIRPQVIVALGATALKGLLGDVGGITKVRGHWQQFRGTPLMPTFHPSFLLRPENADKKRLVWEDMLQVMEKLGLPISEKQRGFFLRRAAD
jgi:uracil-DNA glycosylase